jgi:hypothetical protein
MIFHDLEAIFIHVERTGGVSLRKHLLKYETRFERIAKTKHLTSKETKETVGNLWYEYFTFGFVRNPWERLVSWYFACNQHPEWNSPIAIYMQKFQSVGELIFNPHPQMLITQTKKLQGVDFIGRFENYAEDVKKICGYLRIPYENFKDNIATYGDYRNYYCPRTQRIVADWYKEDIENFGYEL